MLAVALLALAVPVTLAILALEKGLATPAPEPTTEELGTEPLRQALEGLATEKLSRSSFDSDRMEIFLTAKDPGKEQARIEVLARDYQATALPSTDSDGTVRVLISIPGEKVGDFLRKLGASKDVDRAPTEHARLWIEIVIQSQEDR